MGLVNQVVPDGELEGYVGNYCAMIAANAPLTVRAAKVAVREALKDESARDLALCKRLVDECFASQDYAEGRTALMEKRKAGLPGPVTRTRLLRRYAPRNDVMRGERVIASAAKQSSAA